jgi:hypothetical protein
VRTRGSIEPVIYFYNYRDPAHPEGYLMLAPYTSYPTPPGYERREARTLPEVDKMYEVLVRQERLQWEREYFREEATFGKRQQDLRDRLYARMTSGSTGEYEKDFIKSWLELRNEKKRQKYADIFEHRHLFLSARENDIPKGRNADEEKVNLDRIG